MSILKIAKMGHPVLRRVADPVPEPTAPEIARLVRDMEETLADAGGVGLAAPQVHVPLRVVIFHVPGGRTEDGTPVPLTALVNPEIEALTEETVEGWEGCLSIPAMTGMVPRAKRIRYKGITPAGGVIEREASGFHARVVQHECDHLDALLYPMRMTDLSTFGFVDEMRRAMTAADRPEPDEPVPG
ncbi:Peptide deformylase [Caenispirillum salinarum AK4]|uniref:Peptide deformylase n=1 Tax=Caenispirillum salinarum AK4 TaxID=1238182 RepID=K9GKC6_9PROT|nr:peptide deformylase [Caenispirillum salinarum]EKV26480.1 Peptide deformylase [Caenispirillum salinarum AK4]